MYDRSVQRLDTQQAFAIASDQRSLVLSGLAVACAGVIFSATESTPAAGYGEGAAVFMLISAILACISALPQQQYTSGDTPSNLQERLQDDSEHSLVLLGICEQNAIYISENEKKINQRLFLFRLAVFLFGLGILVAAVAVLHEGTP